MNEFELSAKFTGSLAQTNQSFIEFCSKLRLMPQVLNVSRGMDCRRYAEKVVIETYVEAQLTNKNFICWWLEIVKNENEWEISASILRNKDSQQETLKQLPESVAKSINELESALKEQMNNSFLDVTFC